ncbi:hypothetical protein LTR10_024166 [Elasticomyces elasticus]|nr:hypothetical protein LTR10_024166 [Elasticomyces elasticus]KAK5026196.1 hypothetical protein LTS07_007721 [Exophiala sideris]KAK5178111.1 hypothetical protein LTR44_009417 [Eurotiomycetes sp. CCFEE 6388]
MTNDSINATSRTEKAAPNGSSATSIRLSNGRLRDEYYEPISPDHFAPKSGDQILDIGIIGAGIAGLAAAAALVQSGHNVDLRFSSGKTLELLRSATTPDFSQIYDHPWLLYHRADLHDELKRTATQPRPHTSNVARMNLLSEVSDISLDGDIFLADGRKVRKDVIIIADGIRTRFASKIVESTENLRAMATGTVCYRFLVPTDKLLKDPRTRHIFDVEKHGISIAPTGWDHRLVWYPCRGGDLQNFGYFIPDELQGYEDEGLSPIPHR